MCGICGCGRPEDSGLEGTPHLEDALGAHAPRLPLEPGHTHGPPHDHGPGHRHGPPHDHGPGHTHGPPHDHGPGHRHDPHPEAGHPHDPGHTQKLAPPPFERLRIERSILEENDRYAQRNRLWLDHHRVFALNVLSSPGSGKTTLLTQTARALKHTLPLAMVVGDQQTSRDAERLRETGVFALQLNTGRGCHLDAPMIDRALMTMPLPEGGILFIENVGNLVCPADFDLGEAARVVLLSVTEGEDKPLKYPGMFQKADLLLLTKTDLLPHLEFNVESCLTFARRVNPRLPHLLVSARTGEGMDAWLEWLRQRCITSPHP